MADPGVLSSSKITTYKGCPLAYYLTYVAKPKIPIPQRPEKVFGREIHVMLQKFYRKETNKKFKKSYFAFSSKESFINAWKHRWWEGVVKNKFENYEEIDWKDEEEPARLYALGVNMLSAFYDYHIKLPYPKEIEKRFVEDFRGHKLTGVFDRIDVKDGVHYIIDYKTDKSEPSSLILNKHPQFTIYSAIYEKIYSDELNGQKPRIVFYHLRTGKAYETLRNEEDYDYLERLIISTKEGILQDKFTPFYGFHCRFCEYQPICEKFYLEGGGDAKKHEIKITANTEKAKTVDWLTYSEQLKKKKSKFDKIIENLSPELQKFLLEQFRSFFDLKDKIQRDPEARKIFEERRKELEWYKYEKL